MNQRGLYALEYLLFSASSEVSIGLVALAGAGGARRRALVRALARELGQQAERAVRALGDGREYAARFARGGQQSVSLLLAQLILGVETFAVGRVDLVLTLARQRLLKPTDVEGWPSASSHLLLHAALTATERLYRGGQSGGLSELVRAVAPAIDQRVRLAFEDALASTRGLTLPLEQLATQAPNTLDAVLTASKTLELALKVDAASALGVTLTFVTGDGD